MIYPFCIDKGPPEIGRALPVSGLYFFTYTPVERHILKRTPTAKDTSIIKNSTRITGLSIIKVRKLPIALIIHVTSSVAAESIEPSEPLDGVEDNAVIIFITNNIHYTPFPHYFLEPASL